jgi:hypothetical protein
MQRRFAAANQRTSLHSRYSSPSCSCLGPEPSPNPHIGGQLPNSLILSDLGLTLRPFYHREHLVSNPPQVYRVYTAYHTRIERAWHTPGAADASGMRQYQYSAHPGGRIAGSHPVVAAATPHGTLRCPNNCTTYCLHTSTVSTRWRRAMCSVQSNGYIVICRDLTMPTCECGWWGEGKDADGRVMRRQWPCCIPVVGPPSRAARPSSRPLRPDNDRLPKNLHLIIAGMAKSVQRPPPPPRTDGRR